jgi:alkanesulfonate monooxygenase SsuD/methylene tetrahydromethanopterin reductase-like flavin-dependent oxidoreductase (luciferase family)
MLKIGILQEGDARPAAQRYLEMLDEAIFADEMGFSSYGVSERHFLATQGISAPESFLAAVAMRTSRIKVSFSSVIVLSYNHPLRVAEQISTIDVISKGRVMACTARGQQPKTLEVFKIDPKDTRAHWQESVDILIGAMTHENFEYHGKIFDFPPCTLTPMPVQRPHPPLVMTATSLESHRIAGEKGLGVLSGNSLIVGWAGVEQMLAAWRDGLARAEPVSSIPPKAAVAALVTHCAPTPAQAKEEAFPRGLAFLDQTIKRRRSLAPSSPDFAYQIKGFDEIEQHRDDFNYLIDRSPYFSVGDPEFFIERCKRLEAMGADEAIFTIEGMSHKHHMQTIQLIGKYVIPNFRT